MLSQAQIRQIEDAAQAHWNSQAQRERLLSRLGGKEVGHTIAAFVETETVRFLGQRLTVRQEKGTNGKARARSMGDAWLVEAGIAHPLNVKAGEHGKSGQPNMVSMTKLLRGLQERKIDSYLLLLVSVHTQAEGGAERG
jgi:uncharacterized cupin superfamily protein